MFRPCFRRPRPTALLQRRYNANKEFQQSKVIVETFSHFQEKYDPPKYPIVLCHGFSGFDKLVFLSRPMLSSSKNLVNKGVLQLDYWRGITESLEDIGCRVMVGRVPPFGTIEDRARHLDSYIANTCSKTREQEQKKQKNSEEFPMKVNLVSHSMGGLDCRYLIAKLEQKNYKVASLTTVSTPHHGSECADFFMDLWGNNKLLRRNLPSIEELTTRGLIRFNQNIRNDPNVAYFSYGARFIPRWFSVFNITWNIVRRGIEKKIARGGKLSIDNDGIVSVDSAKWGEYIGTLDGVDHLDLINWTNKIKVAFDKFAYHQNPKFNAVALYLSIANSLAKKGF